MTPIESGRRKALEEYAEKLRDNMPDELWIEADPEEEYCVVFSAPHDDPRLVKYRKVTTPEDKA